jgi:hypothetical protein
MCFDFGISEVAMAASIMSTVVSAATSIMGGIQQQKMADYNASMQKQQAKMIERSASTDVGIQREKVRMFAGQERVAMGASNIVPDEGSFGDILAQTAEFGERDAQRIRVNAANQAWGHRAQAAIDSYGGEQAFNMGFYKAGGTILGGAAKMFGGDIPWYHGLTAINPSDMVPNAMTLAASKYGV